LAGLNNIKHCGEKTKFDDANQYPKSVDDLLEKATKKLRNWAALIDAPIFLIGSGTPCNVFPTSNVPNVRLNGLDSFAPERKIQLMALARARICAWLTYNCKNDDWDRLDQNSVHYVEKPLLNVRYADRDGHHGKIDNYLHALAIRNSVTYALQRSKIAQDLKSKSLFRTL
jgi:hypothetical protein